MKTRIVSFLSALFALALVLIFPAGAETAFTETNTITVDTRGLWLGNVEVMVMDGTTGNMIPGAAVTVAAQTQLTNSGGMARFNNLPAATYTFGIVKTGYVSADKQQATMAGCTMVFTVPLYAGTSVDLAQIPNAGAQVISDIGADGSKRTKLLTNYKLNGTAPDYSVTLRYRRGAAGAWTAIAPVKLADYSSNSPDAGVGVKPGQHSVAWDVTTDLPNMHEPALQVEITATRSGRTAVKETQFITVDTRGETLGTLTGRIVKTGGTPLAGATVLLMPHNKTVVTGADGIFSITSLVPGTGCVLKATAKNYQPLVKNSITAPSTSVSLGDLTLTAEARQMLVRPLNPNPNHKQIFVPLGGSGYLFYQVMSADGKLPCPGQTVLLETGAGTLIPQSSTVHENWAGPIAGISDKDGIVRLEVPASAIGGLGSSQMVRIRTTGGVAPDTANFPTGTGGSVFNATVYVVAREWEQVRTLETSAGADVGLALGAGANLGVERSREVAMRSLYSQNVLKYENISSGIQVVGKAGVELSTPEVKVKVMSSGAGAGVGIGANGYLGLVINNEYKFEALGGAPSSGLRDNSFKLYHCLRDDLRDYMPASTGYLVVGVLDSQVLPAFANQLVTSETGAVLGGGASAELQLGGTLMPGDQLSVGAEVRLEGNIQMEKSWGRYGDGISAYTWDGVAGSVSAQVGAGLNLASFDSWLPQAEGYKPPGWATARLSAAMELGGTKGCYFDTKGPGGMRSMTLVEELAYTAPGGSDVGAYLDPTTFPDLPVAQRNQTRKFVVDSKVVRTNGAAIGSLEDLRGASPQLHSRRKEALSNFSRESQYEVTYDRRMETGEASPGGKVGFDMNLGLALKFEASGRNLRSAGSVVEHGRIWAGRELPEWTSAAPQQSEVPADTMLSVMTGWAGTAASDLTSLAAQAATKTVKTVAGKVVNVWKKVTFQAAPSPGGPGGPEGAPPITSDGWENYGISGLYELTSDTPITTGVPLVISFTSVDLAGGDAANLAAYYFVPETSEWQRVSSTLDATAQTVTVDATRTGYYGLALPRPAGNIVLVLDGTAPLLADGATTATVRAAGLRMNNGTPVPNGTLYTVQTNGFTLTGADADTEMEGFQVAADNATLTVAIRTPQGGLAAMLAVSSVSGEAKGSLEIALRDSVAPVAPVGLALTGMGSTLRAAWTVSTSPDVSGYRVYYKAGTAGPLWDGVSSVEGDASPLFTDESFADLRGLVPGTTYYVAIAAVDETGNESALSTPAALLLQATPPASPAAGTVVKGADGNVFISWTLSADDLLGQRNVDHYDIRRRLPGGQWTVIGTASSGQNTFGDTWPAGLAAGEYPEYSIIAMPATGSPGEAGSTVFDSDSDTLPDPWETATGLDPLDPADATANGDGDLRNNLEEYLAGSFPGVSDGTAFEITQLATATATNGTRMADPGTVRLSWNTTPTLEAGQSYVVESTTPGGSPNWQLVANAVITVVNRTGVAVVPVVEGAPALTYRINISGGPDSYRTWIAQSYPGSTDANLIGGTVDPDHDGIPNAVEMVLGGNPATATENSLMPTLAFTAADFGAGTTEYFVFTYRRTARAVAAGFTCQAQYSSDLTDAWTTAAVNENGVKVLTDPDFHGAGIDRVRVYIPRAGKPTAFGRLRVLVP